jgi:hypothetical protein
VIGKPLAEMTDSELDAHLVELRAAHERLVAEQERLTAIPEHHRRPAEKKRLRELHQAVERAGWAVGAAEAVQRGRRGWTPPKVFAPK